VALYEDLVTRALAAQEGARSLTVDAARVSLLACVDADAARSQLEASDCSVRRAAR
jgi:hypothetical protein